MKKAKILLASALVLTSIFSVGIQGVYADTKESAVTVESTASAKDKTDSVELEGNPTTGYEWQYEIKDTSIANLASKNYVSSDPTGERCGAGGTYTWSFVGLKEGETEVTFKYLRSWETDVLESKTYVIKVDSDLKVTIIEKNMEDPIMGSISLHGNFSTGYVWQYAVEDKSIAELTDEEIISDDPTGERCGAGETHIWKVKGLKEGSTEVTFNYLRPWESEIDKNVTYIVNVDSNLNVTISEKTAESSEDAASVGTDSTSSDATNTDSTTSDEDTTGITVHVKEIKDGNVNEYTKKISSSEIKQYFDEFSSFIDDTIKKEQEQMNKFFNFFKMNF